MLKGFLFSYSYIVIPCSRQKVASDHPLVSEPHVKHRITVQNARHINV